MIIVASFTRESGQRKICDCIMREMICSPMISYFDFTTHHSRFTTTKSSVQCHFDFNDVAVSIFLSVYSMEFFNFKHGQENTFTLPPFRSWKMDVTIIQDSKNFNTHHNFSFSCQEVRFLLIILLALFIFLSDV